VAVPLLLGGTLLVAGAVSAAKADAWVMYALSASIGAAFPIAYTLDLMRRHRFFLRGEAAIARNRRRIAALQPVGWLVGGAALVALAAFGGAGKTVVYASLGGLTIGFWPGFLANFVRLWGEEWDPPPDEGRHPNGGPLV
jgi:hypothetical protein